MLTGFVDVDAIAQETRTERLEQRIKPTVKKAIEMAAALSGTDTSDFIVTAAFEAALRRLEETTVSRLDAEESARFFAAIDRAKAEGPTAAMTRLMEAYEENVENAL